MSVYKDTKQGTWYVSFRYVDWTGEKKQKMKRGFRTKKEAQNYEKEFIRKAACLLYNKITKNCRPKWRKLHLQIGEKCRGIWLVPGTV